MRFKIQFIVTVVWHTWDSCRHNK